MEEQITLDLISTFSDVYNSDPQNKMIEDKITKNGLEESLINKTIIKENKPVFNIELPDSKRYDQKDNFRCWIYSGLNTIKYDVAKNLNIDLKSFSLSNSYIAFFDKLEKSNNTYENIINLQDISLKYINKEKILKDCVSESGNWKWFVSIVNKYGLVPYECMQDAFEDLVEKNITNLFTEKVKKDCIKLINEKNNNKNIEDLRKIKEGYLKENYVFFIKNIR